MAGIRRDDYRYRTPCGVEVLAGETVAPWAPRRRSEPNGVAAPKSSRKVSKRNR